MEADKIYAHRKYKMNPKIRKMMENQLGLEKSELSNVDVENLLRQVVLKGEFNKDRKYSDIEKEKIFFMLNEIDPNGYEDSELLNLSNFIKNVLNKDEIINYVTTLINRRYKPGLVYQSYRITNEQIVLFISLFYEYFKTYNGVIINSKFIGDMKKTFPNIDYDEQTGELKSDVNLLMNDLIKEARETFNKDIKIAILDDIYVFATDNEDILQNFKEHFFKGLKIEVIPEFYFDFK